MLLWEFEWSSGDLRWSRPFVWWTRCTAFWEVEWYWAHFLGSLGGQGIFLVDQRLFCVFVGFRVEVLDSRICLPRPLSHSNATMLATQAHMSKRGGGQVDVLGQKGGGRSHRHPHRNSDLTRRRATHGCRSYNCGCRATLYNYGSVIQTKSGQMGSASAFLVQLHLPRIESVSASVMSLLIRT